MAKKRRRKSKKLRFPIFLKLTILMTILLGSIGLINAILNSNLFDRISSEREENFNLVVIQNMGRQVDTLVQSFVEKTLFYSTDILFANNEDALERSKKKFSADSDLLFLQVYQVNGDEITPVQKIFKEEFLTDRNLEENYFEKEIQEFDWTKKQVSDGEIIFRNDSKQFAKMFIGVPVLKDDFGNIEYIALGYLRLSRLQNAFSGLTQRIFYVVDPLGMVLAHPDEKLAYGKKDYSKLKIIQESSKSKIKIMQQYLREENDEEKLMAYYKAKFGMIVIGEAPSSLIQAPAKYVRKQSFFILGVVISIAMYFVFIFSSTITTPIEQLLMFSRKIAKGNFNIHAKRKIKSRDEVGQLARSFDKMAKGLRERDKIKTMFSKFHGSSVAEDILSQDLTRRGENKNVTVYFSDIRSFTDFTERHTAEEVVDMLNGYFEIMVGIIIKHNGVVDKFIGDAIMAVWGAPTPTDHDTHDAIAACMEMREGLVRFNEKRVAEGKEPILMGAGVHTGSVISGTIGSDERMEYTVIGDAVNTAARIEASTKEFGTDLLVSREVMDIVGDKFFAHRAGEIKAKGKSNLLELYIVDGVIKEDGTQIETHTEYSKYGKQKGGAKTEIVA